MKNGEWGWQRMKTVFVSMVIASACLGIAAPVLAEESMADMKAMMQQMKEAMHSLEQKMMAMEAKQVKTEQVISQQAEKADSGIASGLKLPKDTTLSVYGSAKVDAIYTDADGGGDYTYVPAAVPLDAQQDEIPSHKFLMHARQSRFGFASSTSTDYGKFNTKLEFDLFGSGGNQSYSNSYGVRLRRAYGELGHLLAGQEWSTFIDLSMYPETIDFGGAAGSLFIRQAMVRWTQPFTGGSFMFALENPESTYLVKTQSDPAGAWTNSKLQCSDDFPDVIARVNFDAGIGHFSAAGLARHLIIEDGLYDDSTWTGAVSVNALFTLFAKDKLKLEVNYGNGLGRYMESEFDDAFLNPVSGDIETNTQWGGFASYQHYWIDSLRSTFVYSQAERDNDTSYVTDAVDKKYQSVHANLIWSPVPRMDVGIEYIWGYREVENGEDGDINRIQTAVKYKF